MNDRAPRRISHDGDYFRQRAAEARAAAFRHDEGEDAEIAGHLALAYAALARRRKVEPADAPIQIIDEIEA